MENQVVNQNQNQELPQVREISVITDEIISLKAQANNMMLMYAIEVGRRLVEAKAMLQHGEWGAWLEEKVEFSHSSANKLMRVYEEYGKNPNSELITNLSYTKALKLLALPENDREEFVQENEVEDMTVKELERAIRERDEALKKLKANADLEAQIKELKRILSETEARAEDADKKVQAMSDEILSVGQRLEEKFLEIEAMKNNPEIPQDLIDKLKAEAVEASRQALEKLKRAKSEAEENAKALKLKVEALEKQAKISNPDLMEFKLIFDGVQRDIVRLFDVMTRFQGIDDKMYLDLTKALFLFFNKMLSRCSNED